MGGARSLAGSGQACCHVSPHTHLLPESQSLSLRAELLRGPGDLHVPTRGGQEVSGGDLAPRPPPAPRPASALGDRPAQCVLRPCTLSEQPCLHAASQPPGSACHVLSQRV